MTILSKKIANRKNKNLKKKVFICPLDWGLGHATRIVPIIQELLLFDYEVVIGISKTNFKIINEFFQKQKKIFFPQYNIKYSKGNSQIFKMIFSIPKIISKIFIEYFFLKKINKTEKFDYIISDNRFGLRNSKCYNIFITHQVFIKNPKSIKFLEKTLNKFNHLIINKFDELWIPDFEGLYNLSGELSHSKIIHKNQHFIGILSRFEYCKTSNYKHIRDILVILSGPEPQRTILMNLIIKELKNNTFTALIVAAKPNFDYHKNINENIKIISHLDSSEMTKAILSSKYIISRSGYSTLMDLFALKKTAIIIPTPGQTEQEYLADYLSNKKMFVKAVQNNFNLKESINQLNNLQKTNAHLFDIA